MDAIRHSLEQKTAQLRAVGQISAALAAAWKLEDTLDAITRITSQVMGARERIHRGMLIHGY